MFAMECKNQTMTLFYLFISYGLVAILQLLQDNKSSNNE